MPTPVEHVGINHGGFYLLEPEQLLHGADVVAILQDVVSADAPWVLGTLGSQKDILPGPGLDGIGVFARQRIEYLHRPLSFHKVEVVQGFSVLELPMQPIHQLDWQHSFAFPVAFGFPTGKISVLDPQAQSFHQTHSGSVWQ